MDIVVAIFVPALAMLAAHWVQWRRVIGSDLPRPVAYAYGTGVILAVCTFLNWYEQPSWERATAYMWIVMASAGAATFAGYGFDSHVERKHLERDAQHRRETYGE